MDGIRTLFLDMSTSRIRLLILLFLFTGQTVIAQDQQQVVVDAQVLEVEEAFDNELGFEWGFGPSIARYTNVSDPDQIVVVGINAFAGIDFRFSPVASFFGHMNLTQFGDGKTIPTGFSKTKLLNLGIDAGMKIHMNPRSRIDAFVLFGIDFGGSISGVIIDKQDGDKDKTRFDLFENDNRAFAGATGGAGVTIRTDILDFTIQGTVTGGLTLVNKNALDNTPRSVPFFAEIPIIVRFFGKEKQRDRDNLIILLEPQVIEVEE